jgi:RimJ/RimL family protein N-acetyltransferase
MELRGDRVRIRRWQRFDDDVAEEWPPYNDPLNVIWNLPRPFSLGMLSLSSFGEGAMRQSWAVEDTIRTLIGRISLREIDMQRRQARLGITLGAPFVSRGLGTEALILFLNFYFNDLSGGFEAMVLDVAAPNIRAVRCYERLGFRYVGSDWREAGSSLDRRLIDAPAYADVAHHFRRGQRSLWVEFFEMRLMRAEWLARQAVRAE